MHQKFFKYFFFFSILSASNIIFATALYLINTSEWPASVVEGSFFVFKLMPFILVGSLLLGYALLNYKKVTTYQTTNIVSVIMYSAAAAGYEVYDLGEVTTGQIIGILLSSLGAWVFISDNKDKDL